MIWLVLGPAVYAAVAAWLCQVAWENEWHWSRYVAIAVWPVAVVPVAIGVVVGMAIAAWFSTNPLKSQRDR